MEIRPLRGKLIGEILERGERKTAGGIIMMDDDGTSGGIRPRWFKIKFVNNDTEEFIPGDYVLVEHGRWSRELHLEGSNTGMCCIEEDSVLLKSDEAPV